MRTKHREGRGFTLIELLIVVAIIAILAAIAVPNFLEAQTRAKVSRAMTDMRTMVVAHQAYMVDYTSCLRDWNDTDWPSALKDQMGFVQENPGKLADVRFKQTTYPLDTGDWMPRFYSNLAFRPLTTPVAYITSVAPDTFSKVVPLGLDTREVSNSIVYWAFLCSGPDRDDGDWFRDYSPSNRAEKYDPTNGTVSNGDIWRGERFLQTDHFRDEYPTPM